MADPEYTEQPDPEPTPAPPSDGTGWQRGDGTAVEEVGGGGSEGPTLMTLDEKINRLLQALGLAP